MWKINLICAVMFVVLNGMECLPLSNGRTVNKREEGTIQPIVRKEAQVFNEPNFDTIHSNQPFAYWYVEEGMDKRGLLEAQEDQAALEKGYEEVAVDSVDGEGEDRQDEKNF